MGRDWNDVKASSVGGPPKSTTMTDALAMMENLVARAELLAQQTGSKLAPVMGPPNPHKQENDTVMREWPPMFGQMRSMMFRIEAAFDEIQDYLDRVEL